MSLSLIKIIFLISTPALLIVSSINLSVIHKLTQSAQHHTGVMTSQGSIYEQKSHIDWPSHISGKVVQGLSPVNEDTREVEFYGGEIVSWHHGERLSSGKVRVVSTYYKNEKYCRIFQSYIKLNGAEKHITKHVCRIKNIWQF